MKIVYLPAYFTPEQTAGSYLNDQRNQAFANMGIDIEVHVPTPCRGISAEVRAEYCKKEHKYEVLYEGHMSLHRFRLYAEGKNPILRAIRYAICWIKQLYYGLCAKNTDCIYLASTPPIQGLIGVFVHKFKKIPFVYNLQDIFPDSLVGTRLAKKNGLLWKIGRIVENLTYRHAEKIIVISEDFKRNIMAKGVPEEKIEVIYNWVDQDAIIPIKKEDNQLFEKFGINREKFHVVYAGNLGYAQNIDVIIESAKELACNKEVEFLIFGTGGLKEQYVEMVARYNIDNVKFFPLQPMELVSQVYGLGDVCVVSCKPGLGGAAMPSKTLSIMSAGRAVVASFDKGELTYILDHYKCGIHAPAGNVQAFVKIIQTLSVNRRMCAEMGHNARQLILERFTREYGTQRYVDIIKSVIK